MIMQACVHSYLPQAVELSKKQFLFCNAWSNSFMALSFILGYHTPTIRLPIPDFRFGACVHFCVVNYNFLNGTFPDGLVFSDFY